MSPAPKSLVTGPFCSIRARAAWFALACLLGTATLSAQVATPRADTPGYEVIPDLRYSEASRSPRRNSLDLYVPDNRQEPPLLMFLHGGTWMGGSKERHKEIGRTLAAGGVATALINYRLFPFARWPDFAQDGAAAFSWLHDRAGEYGFDKDRMFLMGHSAGGHIGAAVAYDNRWLAAHGKSRDIVRGFIGLSGVYDVRPPHAMLRGMFGATPKIRADASPFVFVDETAPPSLVFWADNDIERLDVSGRMLAARLALSNTPVQSCQISGHNHASYLRQIGKRRDVISDRVLKFIAADGRQAPGTGGAARQWDVLIERDLRYVKDGAPAQTLDFYRPDRPGPAPLLVLVHDGDWTGGDKRDLEPLARACAHLGLAMACVNHRLVGEAPYPAAVRDIALACSWLDANAAKLNYARDKFNLGGIGTGGQLALVAALDPEWLDATGAQRNLIKTVTALSAPCDVRPDLQLFRDVFGDDPKDRELASPKALVRRNGPQVMLAWGGDDPGHILWSNREMPTKLDLARQRHVSLELPDFKGREMTASTAGLHELVALLVGFFGE